MLSAKARSSARGLKGLSSTLSCCQLREEQIECYYNHEQFNKQCSEELGREAQTCALDFVTRGQLINGHDRVLQTAAACPFINSLCPNFKLVPQHEALLLAPIKPQAMPCAAHQRIGRTEQYLVDRFLYIEHCSLDVKPLHLSMLGNVGDVKACWGLKFNYKGELLARPAACL